MPSILTERQGISSVLTRDSRNQSVAQSSVQQRARKQSRTISQSVHSTTNRIGPSPGIDARITVPNPHPLNVTTAMTAPRKARCRNG